jgi:hypothetical protein
MDGKIATIHNWHTDWLYLEVDAFLSRQQTPSLKRIWVICCALLFSPLLSKAHTTMSLPAGSSFILLP